MQFLQKDQYAEVMEKYRKVESDAEDQKRSFEAREQVLSANLARLESRVSELSQYEEQAKSQKNVFVEDLDRVKALPKASSSIASSSPKVSTAPPARSWDF